MIPQKDTRYQVDSARDVYIKILGNVHHGRTYYRFKAALMSLTTNQLIEIKTYKVSKERIKEFNWKAF